MTKHNQALLNQVNTVFTVKFLDALQPKNKPYRVFEGKARAGFGVQISSGGKVSFIYLYRHPHDGKQRVMTLGAYMGMGRDGQAKAGGTTLKEACDVYAHWRSIREQGLDPQAVRDTEMVKAQTQFAKEQQEYQRLAAHGTIEQLIQAYTDNLKAANKRSWSDVKRLLEANVYGCIPQTTKACDVTPDDVREVLAVIIQREALILANRVRASLSAAFTFGIGWDYDPHYHFETLRFGIKTNPVRDVPKPVKSEKPRDRALSASEIQQLWNALEHASFHPKTIAAIRLLFALGGQRVEEILTLRTTDIDLTSRLVTFLHTKNGNTHVVPFGDVADVILKPLMMQADASGLLFGKSGSPFEPMESPTLSHAIGKLCKRHAIASFQPKDIRRTVKTLMGFCGIRKADRDRFQNHALTDVSSKHYDRYEYLAEKRQVMAVWDAYLQSLLLAEPEINIVPCYAQTAAIR